ncbi:tetratricopeptide repeat protein [Melioribacter sp. OK-6-Me]|uniref:tetratricopeptide repeat protein n=1 Tax=unclassified Melioribacter TaxID=2627329 RepID=UPI003EDA8969
MILLILLIHTTIGWAQPNLDSLRRSISTLPDSLRVMVLTDICWKERTSNPQLAIEAGEEAIQIAEKINNKSLHARALNLLGVVYRNKGNYARAIDYYKKALILAEQVKDSVQIGYSYNNIGGIYRIQGNNPLALEYVLKGLKIFEQLDDKRGMAFCNINIGLVYKNQKNYEKALEYLNKTIELREEIKDEEGKALAMNLIAEIYKEQNRLNEALGYYRKIERIYKSTGNKTGLASVWGGIGDIYFEKGQYKSALDLREKALVLLRNVNSIEGIANNLSNMSLIYYKLGDETRADEAMNEAIKLVEKYNIAYVSLECYENATKLSEMKGDFETALKYHKKLTNVKDSLINRKSLAVVKALESIYENEKQKKENELLIKDIEFADKQRKLLIIITLLILLTAVVIYNRYRAKKVVADELAELNNMKDTFFRILAHDLKSPFNTIFVYTNFLISHYDEIDDSERKQFIESIERAAKSNYQLLENLLMWSQAQMGKLEMQIVNIDLYEVVKTNFFLLEEVAKSKEISLETSIEPGIEVLADENILNTIFRNLISNGIKFSEKGGKIFVDAVKEDKMVKITVADNGVGMDKETMDKLFVRNTRISKTGTSGEKGSGLGLLLCKDFIEKLEGEIWVESELDKGSKFIFTLRSYENQNEESN